MTYTAKTYARPTWRYVPKGQSDVASAYARNYLIITTDIQNVPRGVYCSSKDNSLL